MSRRQLILVAAAAAATAAGCSPTYDVTVGFTIDGADPATVCEFLPAGNVVRLTAISRDTSDERNSPAKETSADVACDKGTGTIQTSNFAEVRAEVVADEEVFGTSPVLSINPGAPGSGYQIEEEAAVADIRMVRGTLTANLTVIGQSCGDAGAASFTVSLFQNVEPRSNTVVVEDVTVDCKDGVATFVHAPVDIDSEYVIVADTTVGATPFRTGAEGEGIRTAGSNTFFTVDLEAAE
jgi:hypothetical protein